MKLYSVYDKEFAPYGKVITGYDTAEMRSLLKKFSKDNGTDYVASDNRLEATELASKISSNIFGGLEIEIGCCYGVNTKLNCLEYHRTSEINLADEDFILLLAKEDEIKDGWLDTSCVKAFLCPKETLINIFATTLHYAPCSSIEGERFAVMVALPRGTNTTFKPTSVYAPEDRLLWAKNKWLIAHKESNEAKNGAYIGLTGKNIDIKEKLF